MLPFRQFSTQILLFFVDDVNEILRALRAQKIPRSVRGRNKVSEDDFSFTVSFCTLQCLYPTKLL